jgi:hypothetical protein
MTKKILFITFLLIFSIALSGCGEKQASCTTEAKICPDGTYVGRNVNNNCEFYPCPEESARKQDSDTENEVSSPIVEEPKDKEDVKKEDVEVEIDELTEEQDKIIPDIDSIVVESDKIKVFGIKAGDTIKSPITIQGEGTASENILIVELRNSGRTALVREPVTIKPSTAGQPGVFKITLGFSFQNTKEGYVAVYEESAEDGSPKNIVEIPVKFEATE